MDVSIKCLTLLLTILASSQVISSSQSIAKTPTIPPILKLCQKNDPNLKECLRKVVETIRPNLTAGIPELLIPPCEPLKIPEIRIVQNAGAIRMESEYSNVVISGLSKFTLREIDVDPKLGRVRAELWFPALEMTSKYLIHGKLLLMPITGSGNAYGNFSDIDATITMKKKDSKTKADGKNRLGDIHVQFNIGNASVKMDNLFNGDPELGAMMNNFLNNNWREITAEIRPALGESIERILYGIAAQLNDMYGLDKLLQE